MTPRDAPAGDVQSQLPFASKALRRLSPVSATNRTLFTASQVTPMAAFRHVELACVLLHLLVGVL